MSSNRIIKKYGRTPEYWLMELARVNRENLEDSLEADRALEEMRKKGYLKVRVDGEVLGAATGRAKKEAEQEAARLALARLEQP